MIPLIFYQCFSSGIQFLIFYYVLIGYPFGIYGLHFILAQILVIFYVGIAGRVIPDGCVYFRNLTGTIFRSFPNRSVAIHTGIGRRNQRVLTTAGSIVTVLTINFIETSVRDVRKFDRLVRLVILLSVEIHSPVHGYVTT